MLTKGLVLAMALFAAACGGDKDKGAKPEATKPEAAKPEAAKPEAAKPEAVTPEAAKPEAVKPEGSAAAPAPTRPASITQEMQDTIEAYIVLFDTLMTDLGAAADCKGALAAIEKNRKALDELEARGAKLRDEIRAVREAKDPVARDWFSATYESRVKQSIIKAAPIKSKCDDKDPALRAAMETVMPRYPMMKKKGS